MRLQSKKVDEDDGQCARHRRHWRGVEDCVPGGHHPPQEQGAEVGREPSAGPDHRQEPCVAVIPSAAIPAESS